MIIAVDETNLLQAAEIHSISWKESHRSFCTPDFVEMHTPENQQVYMRNKMNCGSKFYMLVEDKPIGIVSIKEYLIEDLYILPDRQSMGYGTKLLQFAVEQCTGIPTLWILENNTSAKRLYCKIGFQETGRIHAVTDGLDEIELSLHKFIFVEDTKSATLPLSAVGSGICPYPFSFITRKWTGLMQADFWKTFKKKSMR